MAYYTTRAQRHAQARRAAIYQLMWVTLGKALGAALVGVLIAWVMINWMMGCGETFTTIDGAVIYGECVTLTLGAF